MEYILLSWQSNSRQITEHTEKGLASADRTMSILAFATKGKTQMGEGSREKLQIDLADEMQSGTNQMDEHKTQGRAR